MPSYERLRPRTVHGMVSQSGCGRSRSNPPGATTPKGDTGLNHVTTTGLCRLPTDAIPGLIRLDGSHELRVQP